MSKLPAATTSPDTLSQQPTSESRRVRDEIGQQLQILRDLVLLTFLGDGSYRFR